MEVLNYQEIVAMFINTVVGLAIPFIARELVRLLAQGVEYVKAVIVEKSPHMLDVLYFISTEAIAFAEQAGFSEAGEVRLGMAVEYVQREMEMRGFGDVDVALIVDKLESALFEELNKYKLGFKG